MPFNVGKVGQVAASRHPILVEDAAQNDWVVRPEWAKREEIPVLQVIRSSFETNCWGLSLFSAANLSVNASSLG